MPGRAPEASGVARWVPGIAVVRTYQRAWFRNDALAALVLTALLVPQGMAYAELAGLPAVTGLYTTVTALLAYAIFGPSKTLVLGPDSSLAPVIAAIIAPLVVGDSPAEAVALAGMVAILAGLIEVGAGLLRFGTVADLLSMPIRIGYLNGIALLVLASQLPKLFGFSSDSDGFIDAVANFVEGVFDGESVTASLLLGAASIVVIGVGRLRAPRVPWVLLSVVVSIAIVALFDLGDDGVATVGALPSGFPTPTVPTIDWGDLASLLVGALAVAVVSVADTAALSRSFSAKRGHRIDQNREAVGLGAANLAAGLFQGFPMSASSSRTVVADSVGAKSQLTGVLSAFAIVVLLVGANDLLTDLPSSVLAAIVIVASFALFDFKTIAWLARARRSDFAASVIAMLGVVLVGVLEGLLIAIVVSLGVFVWMRWRPHTAVLGRLADRKGYHDTERHPNAYRVPGLLLFRFDAPLFFANAPYFEERLLQAIEDQPSAIRRVVVAGEAMTDIDSTGSETLGLLLDKLDARGIEFAFAELKGPVKDRLRRYGLYERLGAGAFHPTIGQAVVSYADDSGAPARPVLQAKPDESKIDEDTR
ncbi:MAG: sulfate permease [Acidimicrobiales bacterium]|nr:sulfate permease [Acidimicrobiales bacterium]